MKILHTADWHIGKVLHKYPLQDDHEMYFDWLLQYIETEAIDLLLISGDVFEMSNPASKDRETYYQILSRLINTKVQVVITGGNHDSVAMLNAPRKILANLNVTVVGGAHIDEPENEIIEIVNDKGQLECVVLAVPYLRDRDIRKSIEGETYTDRTESIRKGIAGHFQNLISICNERYAKEIPIIGMGHLYMQDSDISESEREIQVGNQAGLDVGMIPSRINYMALGHIHKPQEMAGRKTVRYSGSPIPLSFSEKKDKKQMVLLELKDQKMTNIETVFLPQNRELKKFSGTLEKVKAKLAKYKPQFPLTSLVELSISEEKHDAIKIAELQDISSDDYPGNFQIIKQALRFDDNEKLTNNLFEAGVSIEELSPKEVFEKRLLEDSVGEEDKALLMEAFVDILQIVMEEQED